VLKAVSISCAHDGDLLFTDVDLVVGPGDRIGVVGPNGAGKTTLLRVLAGELAPASGAVTRGPGTRIGHVTQHVPDPDLTVGAFLTAGLGELATVTARMRVLESALERGEDVLDEYGRVQDRWTALEGWTADTRLAEIRQRLDLAHLPADRPLRAVSGGEQARLMLARALLDAPDVLLLDEPTNHLDADGAAWLQDWLRAYPGGVVTVSHDRAFLDAAVSHVVELDGIHTEPQDYPGGGYTAYRAEKARRWQRLRLDYEAQQKDLARWEADIARTKEQARSVETTVLSGAAAPHLRRVARLVARKAVVRERRLRRQMAAATWIAEPRTRPPLTLAFPDDTAGDDVVLAVSGLTVARAGRTLLAPVDLTVRRGDRILITGRNGAGKTTLLQALAGAAAPGTVAVLPQTTDGLRLPVTVLDWFRSQVPVYAEDAERLLESHLFGPDMWDARLRSLSAGELRRLVLAAMVNSEARVLMLDEPTNFLDFDALDVLEAALREYRGTVLTVTHDRWFAAAAGHTRSWHVADGRVTGN
jgi:ATPase subunit of ABC transporter with duplicated ATPase domains